MIPLKVSVIIPVYNGEAYIAQAIDSVLSQSYKNYEVIIINDGSTDNSYQKIKPFLNISNVKYIEQKNRGVTTARNVGIRNSEGELIGFLDHDDMWLPEKLELQVDYLLSHSDIGLVHTNRKRIYEEGTEILPEPPPTKAVGWCFRELFFRNQISGMTVLLRRKCLNKAGLFDERLFSGEDYELWLRISKYYPFGYIDQVSYLYRQHGLNMSHNWERALLGEIKVIEIILQKFPEIYRELGMSVVKKRVFELYHRAADFYLYLDKRKSARKYYWKSLSIRPMKWDCWNKLLIWSSLNPRHRNMLQWYKHKINKLLHKENISNGFQQD